MHFLATSILTRFLPHSPALPPSHRRSRLVTLSIRLELKLHLALDFAQMPMKRTEEVTHDDGLPRQALYYMENKGYIQPHRKQVGRRVLREYSESDIELAKLIWKYHDEDGLVWHIAHERAVKQLDLPHVG